MSQVNKDSLTSALLASFLKEKGYTVTSNSRLKGLSGITHEIAILTKVNEKKIGFDFTKSSQVDELLRFFAKSIDLPEVQLYLLLEKKKLEKFSFLKNSPKIIAFESTEDLLAKVEKIVESKI